MPYFSLSSVAVMVLAGSICAETGLMPVAQQNALIEKHCAVCHTDAARNGGLSLRHFDAAQLDPSLAAMLVSKIRGGAVGADGKPTPDKATIAALENALDAEAAGSSDWYADLRGPVKTVSTLQRVSGGREGLYRLVVSCKPESRTGGMQVSWSPSPRTGTMRVVADGGQAVVYKVEGSEAMGNGSPLVVNGQAALDVDARSLPSRTLTVSELFPGETLTFPFDKLGAGPRSALSACFQ